MATLTPKLIVQAELIANPEIASGVFAMDVRAPELARALGPGQFVEVKCSDGWDPLLRRPFSICDHLFDDAGEIIGLRILYMVIGRGTGLMAAMRPGELVDLIGPLGETFLLDRIPQRAVFLAGGIGSAPFPLLARTLKTGGCTDIEMLFGVRDANAIHYVDEFEALGIRVLPATDDGSLGHHGWVTDLLAQRLPEYEPANTVIYACGPNPMFRSLGKVLETTTVPCQVSLEREMACGFGVCNGCVVETHRPSKSGGPTWEKICVAGPVFHARDVKLDRL